MSNRRELLMEATALLNNGDAARADFLCRQYLKGSPKDPGAHRLRAMALLEMGLPADAATAAKSALKHAPNDVYAMIVLGTARDLQQRPNEALRWFDQVLKNQPNHAVALQRKALLLHMSGRNERAWAAIESACNRPDADPELLAAAGDILIALDRADEVCALLEPRLADASIESLARRNLHYAVGKALLALGDDKRAFEMFATGNELLGPSFFKPDGFIRLHDELFNAFAQGADTVMPRSTCESNRPIFIVGLPRSGSTLVEQIIGAHKSVSVGGELGILPRLAVQLNEVLGIDRRYPACATDLTTAHLDQLAERYLSELKLINRHARRVTDKMLTNYLNIGLISRMLPNARMIHVRRNPLDVGVSCYLHLSVQVQPWAAQWEWIATAIQQHDRLMSLWRQTIPASQMLCLSYEELVGDTEPVVRRILEFCDLPWDDAVLEHHKQKNRIHTHSYAQASRPVYRSSVGRSERFGSLIEPFRRALQETA